MKNFMLIFRFQPDPNFQMTPEQEAESGKQWGNWIGSIAHQGKFVSTAQLGFTGAVLQTDLSSSDGIYTANSTAIGGNMVIKTDSQSDALDISKGCPILEMGGSVEVREILPM